MLHLTSAGSVADKLLCFFIWGPPAVFAAPWAFGEVVEMQDPALGVPGMTGEALSVPTMGSPAVEV
jgi:hypothetical protein